VGDSFPERGRGVTPTDDLLPMNPEVDVLMFAYQCGHQLNPKHLNNQIYQKFLLN